MICGRRGREPVWCAGAVEADQGVEVDDAAALVLGDLGVLDGGQVAHAAAGDAERLGDQPAQGDGEPAPQVGCPPLPHDLGGVVVAVRAQRLTQLGVVVAVPHQAARRPTVRAAARAAVRPSAGLDAVHVTERRCGERREHQRVVGHRLGHGLAADDTGADQVEDIGRVDARARRAHRRAPVPAPDVGHAERSHRCSNSWRGLRRSPGRSASSDPRSRIGWAQLPTRARASENGTNRQVMIICCSWSIMRGDQPPRSSGALVVEIGEWSSRAAARLEVRTQSCSHHPRERVARPKLRLYRATHPVRRGSSPRGDPWQDAQHREPPANAETAIETQDGSGYLR